MTFYYVLSTNVGKVRLELGDTVDGAGVLPGGANLQNEEIQVLLDRETSVLAASAAACELLSRAWAKVSSSLTTGPISESFTQSKQWADSAVVLRARVRSAAGGGFASVKLVPPTEWGS